MGNRYVKDNRPGLKPVERIELDDKHNQRKIIIIILLLVFALACFGYSISQLLKVDKGWTVISVNAGITDSCGDDFTLNYYLGNGDTPTTAEKKAITLVYSEASQLAYKMFNADQDYPDVLNIHYINNHPNEIIEVEPYLYESFQLIKKKENRNIYLGPTYQMYDDIFYMEESSLMDEFDPLVNEEVKQLYGRIAEFAANPEMIDVELLGNNQVRLHVSDEYKSFIEENSLENLIDFFWMKHSFIIDYLADCLKQKGFTLGVLSSFNGCVSTLYNDEIYNMYSGFDLNDDGKIYQAIDFALNGKVNLVYYHNYAINPREYIYVRSLKDGTRNSYLSVTDGLQRAALDNLVVYSYKKSNAEVLLDSLDCYIVDSFNQEDIISLKQNGLEALFFEDNTAMYTDTKLAVDSVFDKDGVSYKAELLK